MAAARAWAEGYLEQARADMRAAALVQGIEPSVVAMLLQMVLEKLGKAALLRSGQISVARATASHGAATRMLQQLARNRRACQRLAWQPAIVQHRVAPLVERIERTQPQLAAGGPCLEYPWEDPAGVIRWPARDLAVADEFRPKRDGGRIVFRFATELCARFDAVFP